MTQTEALKLALEALKHTHPSPLTSFYTIGDRDKAIKAIEEHLAQPAVAEQHKQEPKHVATVAEVHMSRYTIEWTNGPLPEGAKLYDAPQRKPWVSLSEDQIYMNCPALLSQSQCRLWIREIEAKLQELNEGKE